MGSSQVLSNYCHALVESFNCCITFLNFPVDAALQIKPPFKPVVKSDTDVSNFDEDFTSEPVDLSPPEGNGFAQFLIILKDG